MTVVNRGTDDHPVIARRLQTCRNVISTVYFHPVPLTPETLRDPFRNARGVAFGGGVEDQSAGHVANCGSSVWKASLLLLGSLTF